MAKKKQIPQIINPEVETLGYGIMNQDKWQRAIYGSIGREGQPMGGVGEKASDQAKLTEYDRLGGLIVKGKYKLKTGCFYDFIKKQARPEPAIVFLMRNFEGDVVEIPEGTEIPLEVKAAEIKAEEEESEETLDEEMPKKRGRPKKSE